jgi:hypothetical protein
MGDGAADGDFAPPGLFMTWFQRVAFRIEQNDPRSGLKN